VWHSCSALIKTPQLETKKTVFSVRFVLMIEASRFLPRPLKPPDEGSRLFFAVAASSDKRKAHAPGMTAFQLKRQAVSVSSPRVGAKKVSRALSRGGLDCGCGFEGFAVDLCRQRLLIRCKGRR
jgi:hypothetical protein